jgi:indoleacetamide hydrolase
VRVGVVAAMLVNLDDDTKQAFAAARSKLESAGVTVLDVDMPNLVELNGKVSFPVAIYEANDDMVAYLKRGPKIAIADLAKAIASRT